MRLLCPLLAAASLQAAFVPDPGLKPDDYTVLMGVDAALSAGLTPFQPGGHGKFFIQGWRSSDQQAAWQVVAPGTGEYAVQVLVHGLRPQELRVEVSAAGQTLSEVLPAEARRWQRLSLPGTLALPAGENTVTLRLYPNDGATGFEAQVHAVELVRPAVRDALHERALRLRADPTWFQQARYGMMVHWTRESMPLHGERKPYDQAVAEFDAEAFAATMQETGAGFVVFTTSHAFQFFPAPLAALDRVMPGRTSRRDLVADLAEALGRRGLKLFLYYHLGAGSDPDWLAASGFWETDTTRFFRTWQAIVSEAGERYGDRLAGWWFDDGAVTYYYRSAPWEQLARAAKAGFPQRLIAFNPWELNSPTEFQDLFAGEGFGEPEGYNRLLTPGGNGRYPSGTHRGLQGSACLVAGGEWVHTRPDTPPAPPSWDPAQLTALLKGFIACRSVPIFNLEITQDGHLPPESIALFRQVAAGLPISRGAQPGVDGSSLGR